MNASFSHFVKFVSVATIFSGLMLFPVPEGWAQQKAGDAKQIVGVWSLVSTINTSKDGVVTKGTSFGPNPNGRMFFTSSGHYASVNTNPNLPKFASGNRMKGTAEEYKAVVHGSIASFGTYSVSPDGKVLTLRQEGGTWAVRNGTEEKRALAIAGDEMKYTTQATIGGVSELVYKRVK